MMLKMEITKWNPARLFLCIFYYMILLQNIAPTTAGQCRNLSTCSCDCEGDIIDLSDLANKEGAEPRYVLHASKVYSTDISLKLLFFTSHTQHKRPTSA